MMNGSFLSWHLCVADTLADLPPPVLIPDYRYGRVPTVDRDLTAR